MANEEYSFNQKGGSTSAKRSTGSYIYSQIRNQRDEQPTEAKEFEGPQNNCEKTVKNGIEDENDKIGKTHLRKQANTYTVRPKGSTVIPQHLLRERINVKKVYL